MEFSCQKFSYDLFQSIINDNYDKNIIFSPISIYLALGMTLWGAQGETLSEMSKSLYWNQENCNLYHQQLHDVIKTCNIESSPNGTVKIANKLFLETKYNLIDTYVKSLSCLYDSKIKQLDFENHPEQACQDINNWVENETNGKIKNLLQQRQINNQTKLILVNAIYFNGAWLKQFKVIGHKQFYLLNGTSKSIEMISNSEHFSYLKNDSLKFSAVKIPFKIMESILFSFMIILPDERDSLAKVEQDIFQSNWETTFNDDLFTAKNVEVIMPKFKIENSFSLSDELKKLGMLKPFSPDADFSGMTGNKDLMINDVVHKAFIDVDENGIEAAAATAVTMMLGCAMTQPQQPIEFKCDHPFMFVLLKQDSLPFFTGHFSQC